MLANYLSLLNKFLNLGCNIIISDIRNTTYYLPQRAFETAVFLHYFCRYC